MTVVETAVVPVAVQKSVPVALFSLIFARGNTSRVGGIPHEHIESKSRTGRNNAGCVRVARLRFKFLDRYSPTALLVSVVVSATLVPSDWPSGAVVERP